MAKKNKKYRKKLLNNVVIHHYLVQYLEKCEIDGAYLYLTLQRHCNPLLREDNNELLFIEEILKKLESYISDTLCICLENEYFILADNALVQADLNTVKNSEIVKYLLYIATYYHKTNPFVSTMELERYGKNDILDFRKRTRLAMERFLTFSDQMKHSQNPEITCQQCLQYLALIKDIRSIMQPVRERWEKITFRVESLEIVKNLEKKGQGMIEVCDNLIKKEFSQLITNMRNKLRKDILTIDDQVVQAIREDIETGWKLIEPYQKQSIFKVPSRELF